MKLGEIGAEALKNWKAIAAIIAVIAAMFGIGIAITDEDDDGSPDTIVITVNEGATNPPVQEIEVPAETVDAVKEDFTHQDLEEAPVDSELPGAPAIERAAEVQTQVKELPPAGAVQGFKGCKTKIIGTNYSSRNGARAVWQVLHYTVSSNRTGWSDVNAIISLFSNPGRQASSNFIIDEEGHCAYIVPITAKAWTQAGGNPWSISYEVIATGGEESYAGTKGQAKLHSIVAQVARRTGIPRRRGATSSSCTPVRSGIVQHKDFGLCGGGHVDITPFSVNRQVKLLSAGSRPKIDAKIRKHVKNARAPKGTGHTRVYWCRRVRDDRGSNKTERALLWKVRTKGVCRAKG